MLMTNPTIKSLEKTQCNLGVMNWPYIFMNICCCCVKSQNQKTNGLRHSGLHFAVYYVAWQKNVSFHFCAGHNNNILWHMWCMKQSKHSTAQVIYDTRVEISIFARYMCPTSFKIKRIVALDHKFKTHAECMASNDEQLCYINLHEMSSLRITFIRYNPLQANAMPSSHRTFHRYWLLRNCRKITIHEWSILWM